jgi:hypothetical protein
VIKGEYRGKKCMGYYDGETPWNLNPYSLFFGHFSIPRECVNSREILTIEVSTAFENIDGKGFKYLPVAWTYMRDKNQWFYEPREF